MQRKEGSRRTKWLWYHVENHGLGERKKRKLQENSKVYIDQMEKMILQEYNKGYGLTEDKILSRFKMDRDKIGKSNTTSSL